MKKLLKPRKEKELEAEIGTQASRDLARLEKAVEKLEHEVRQCQATANKAIGEIETLKRRMNNV